jgi:hypothetical protein
MHRICNLTTGINMKWKEEIAMCAFCMNFTFYVFIL